MSQQAETRFKERIRPKLEALPNTWVVKIQQVSIRGTPDFLLCIRGRFVALELKRSAQAKITALQKWNVQRISEAGGRAFIVYPDNWDEVYAELVGLACNHG